MPLSLASFQFPGTMGPVMRHAPEHSARTTKFYGLNGESEIADSPAGRNLTCHCWIHNGYNDAKTLLAFLTTLDSKIGFLRGDLTEAGVVNQVFKDVTFKGFDMQEPGPLPDLGKGLLAGKVTWFVIGTLMFRQHTVGTS